ncbi:MAG: DNA-binding protein WhiA [Candidatus Caldatribacteriota bacterium]
MLFYYRVRNELARLIPQDFEEKRDELLAFIRLKGSIISKNEKMDLMMAFHDTVETRISYRLIKEVFRIRPLVKVRKLAKNQKKFSLIGYDINKEKKVFEDFYTIYKALMEKDITSLTKTSFSSSAYLRGIFLLNGFVNDPERMYHLTILCPDKEEANFIYHLLYSYSLDFKIGPWKKQWLVYLKKGDNIFEFLRLLGIQNALLYYQDIRARKDIVNTVNRLVNCETANLNKVICSAVEQLKKIDIIEKRVGLKNIPPKLASAATLRKRYPYASLQEIVRETNYEISKSGLYHRLRKIYKMADELINN